MTGGGLFCRDCGQGLPDLLLQGGRETRILGEAYCDVCVEARSLVCHRCHGGLRLEDFEEGRAVTLAGRRYCEPCLKAIGEKRPGDASGSSDGLRLDDDPAALAGQRHGRFLPGKGVMLGVRAHGMVGILRGDRVRVWLDISEGGFRAILSGSLDLDTRVGGSLNSTKDGRAYPFEAVVKYSRPARQHPGCVIAGCAFVEPSSELLEFIRNSMGTRPVRLPGAADRRAP